MKLSGNNVGPPQQMDQARQRLFSLSLYTPKTQPSLQGKAGAMGVAGEKVREMDMH